MIALDKAHGLVGLFAEPGLVFLRKGFAKWELLYGKRSRRGGE